MIQHPCLVLGECCQDVISLLNFDESLENPASDFSLCFVFLLMHLCRTLCCSHKAVVCNRRRKPLF